MNKILISSGDHTYMVAVVRSKNINTFFEDCKNNNLASKGQSEKYQ